MTTRQSLRPAIRAIAILGLAATIAAGCGASRTEKEAASSASQGPALRVAAASDLQAVLPALAREFQVRTRIAVSPTFGASGQLSEQIKAGAPFDLLLAANRKFVEDLASGGFIRPDSVKPYARGTLVLAVLGEPGGPIRGLADLARPEVVKVALANPATAPYGAAGKQALERSGLWDTVSRKVVQAESVRQAFQFVETGNAEAGLVGLSIAKGPGIHVVDIDPALYDPIVQALGVVSRTTMQKEAEAFARFLESEDGQKILAESGFKPAGPS